MRLRTKNHATKASRASTCIFERESRTRHVGHSHVSQARSSKKTSKSRFFLWLGGVQKTTRLIYRFFLPNSPLPHLGLHHNSLYYLAGKSRLFFFRSGSESSVCKAAQIGDPILDLVVV